MKAVKTLFFLSQFFLILGCEQIFPKKEIVRFKVENNSQIRGRMGKKYFCKILKMILLKY